MAISLLQTEEISASIAYYKALNGDPPTRRCKKNVDTDNKISMYKQMLEAEDLTFEAYFKYINGALFIAIDKKKDRSVMMISAMMMRFLTVMVKVIVNLVMKMLTLKLMLRPTMATIATNILGPVSLAMLLIILILIIQLL